MKKQKKNKDIRSLYSEAYSKSFEEHRRVYFSITLDRNENTGELYIKRLGNIEYPENYIESLLSKCKHKLNLPFSKNSSKGCILEIAKIEGMLDYSINYLSEKITKYSKDAIDIWEHKDNVKDPTDNNIEFVNQLIKAHFATNEWAAYKAKVVEFRDYVKKWADSCKNDWEVYYGR